MSSAIYDKALEAFTNGQINLPSDTIKAILVDSAAYTIDLANHQFLSSIPGGARIGTAVTLASKVTASGTFDAADVSFTGLTSAPTIEYVIIYKDTGVEGTSNLIAAIDGMQTVTIAAAASGGATSVTIDPLSAAVASGAVLTKVSGTGPATITTSASGSAAARSLTVTALSGAAAVGDVYTVAISGVGLPVAAGATQIDIAWSNGANKIFKL